MSFIASLLRRSVYDAHESALTTSKENPLQDHEESILATFAATLSLSNAPESVQLRTEDLFLDWIGSTLAGKNSRPVQTISRFAGVMGPATGLPPARLLWPRSSSRGCPGEPPPLQSS